MLCLEWLQPPLAHAGPTIPMGYAADAPTATRVTLAVALGLQGSGSHFPEYPVLGHARPDLRAVCSEQGGSVQMCLPGNSLALQLGGVYLFILPKGPVGFAVALFVFSPCRYPKAELRTYQSISVVKHDLSAGRAAGISQVGVGVVDGESTQTWQGDRDTAEAVSGGRTARGTAGGGWFRLWLILGAGPGSAGNTSAVGTSAGTGQNCALPPSPSTGNTEPAFQHALGLPPALSPWRRQAQVHETAKDMWV